MRPDWIDQTEVLGFVNPISDTFVPGWLSETVRDCEREPDRLHFVLLDEMNLAPVEQYLAEWLSAIEEARSGSEDVQLPLYSYALAPRNSDEWPHSLRFPDNLIIIGTVNVDETTRPLSERVLDRANVLLLNVEVSDRHHKRNGEPPAPWHVAVAEWREICRTEPSDDHHEFLVEIADILRQASIGVGLRAHLELERFVANAAGILDDEDALDWGIVQRIIPKIRGFKGHLAEVLSLNPPIRCWWVGWLVGGCRVGCLGLGLVCWGVLGRVGFRVQGLGWVGGAGCVLEGAGFLWVVGVSRRVRAGFVVW